MTNKTNKIAELAPCGVYCGACPSFDKTCKGCASNDRNQDRRSKWSCQIRDCCYNKKGLDYCIFCEEFPCKTINKKLLTTHPGDPKFTYRHEIPDFFSKLKTMSLEDYLEFQKIGGNVIYVEGPLGFIITNVVNVGRISNKLLECYNAPLYNHV